MSDPLGVHVMPDEGDEICWKNCLCPLLTLWWVHVDDELAAIRARRAAQLQLSQNQDNGGQASKAMQEERQRAAEDQRAQILKALLAPSARERRKNIQHSCNI